LDLIRRHPFPEETLNDFLLDGHKIEGHFVSGKLYLIFMYVIEYPDGSGTEYLHMLLVKAVGRPVRCPEGIGRCLFSRLPRREGDAIADLENMSQYMDPVVIYDEKYSIQKCLDRNIDKIIRLELEDLENF
jgi:hypothetical protein